MATFHENLVQSFDNMKKKHIYNRVSTTTFPSDGSILETYSQTENKRTVFNVDGSISEIYTNGEDVVERKTVFNSDGSISIVDVPQESEGGE
jgi:hypothetical protein